MDDSLCSNFDFLRKHLPDELNKKGEIELDRITNYEKYCPDNNCNTEIDKITIGFLWLLQQYFTKYPKKGDHVNDIKPFFLYIILWLSYKLNQNSEHKTTKINEFYNKHVIDSGKYKQFINDAYKFSGLGEFIDKKKDLLNININDMSNFYDASKLICSMYSNKAANTDVKNLSDNANEFVKKYQELKGYSNKTDGNSYKQILSALLTDYDNLKNISTNIALLPEITADISALKSGDTSSSLSIGNRLFTVLSIFGAIGFFLGISYKYSLFGFRKRAQKQYIREKIKSIKKRMNQ
ncbi:PIR protein [Plasmodium yoelii]|uniref:PIR protein n=2 Tax=Plasmodium yoelii TaxID=5861 RepID=A0AAE9WSG0_PLAYO|nr:PIR protein [Plasmodium yoelii]WBY57669.1 PIR protein [Plasmodium yoelii yoelii]CDS44115.1 YIR protein [Plasmodium yoelii]VTZ78686.1 PIR protein [Plasmodium yoelii]|eukprot:XP_022810664.1 PIR protein [Plasmodium yoelii]